MPGLSGLYEDQLDAIEWGKKLNVLKQQKLL